MSPLSSSSSPGSPPAQHQQSVSSCPQPFSSSSSLLHLHRPDHPSDRQQLQVTVVSEVSDDQDIQPVVVATTTSTVASSPTSSLFASVMLQDSTAYKSLSSSSSLLNLSIASLTQRANKALTAPISRIVSISSSNADDDDAAAPAATHYDSYSSSSSDQADGTVNAMGELHSLPLAIPRSKWQPDEESALCNHPLCTAFFGNSTFSLGPRRHHCRMCGLIFCNNHSSRRIRMSILDSNLGRIQWLRVCDTCIDTNVHITASDLSSESVPARRGSTTNSLGTNTSNTTEDEYLVTPGSESSNPLGRQARLDEVAEIEEPQLAPIQEWMGKQGVLSLYPLAVHPSHSRSAAPHTPSVGPLFAPTLSERRSVRVKQLERLTLRQRRFGKEQPVFSIPGFKRPKGWSSEDEADVEDQTTPSSFVIGGSALFRPRIKLIKPAAGLTTPTRELDWSTF